MLNLIGFFSPGINRASMKTKLNSLLIATALTLTILGCNQTTSRQPTPVAVSSTASTPEVGKKLFPGPWTKEKTPVLVPSSEKASFDSRNVYNMATIVEDGEVVMLYRGESLSEEAGSMTGRFGLATSPDGLSFTRLPSNDSPGVVMEPTEPYESRGIEDPRLLKIEGQYIVTYTGYNGKMGQLCLATSKDLKTWKKYGPLFPEFQQANCPLVPNSPVGASKSGAILPERMTDGPYTGEYIMLFGDTHMHLAHSKDLISWEPVQEPVLSPRWEKFDSLLVESGPPLLRTKDGILVIYNSAGHHTDPPADVSPEEKARLLFPQRKYAVGMALLDSKDPTKVIARSDEPILTVTEEWEETGYVDNVVFAEGLVKVGDRWLLHYGGADHVIGVAHAPFEAELLPEDSPFRKEVEPTASPKP